MTSGGGLVPLADAAEHPAHLLLSGPAAGVRAAAAIAVACGMPDAVSFDMGGTSTDVCLVRGGCPGPTSTRRVAGLPIRLPALAVHTIGAGGGSIAGLDPGGALVVGPGSAGARARPRLLRPGGPRRDGDRRRCRARAAPGRHRAAGDRPARSRRRARCAGPRRGDCRGRGRGRRRGDGTCGAGGDGRAGDRPARLALVAFGGAGPLHACAVAEQLGMRTVIVPPRAGVFSAVGLVCSPQQRELVRSWATPRSTDGLAEARGELAARRRGAGARGARWRAGWTAVTWARATSSRCGSRPTSPRSTSGATGSRARAPRWRSSRCGRG